MTHFCTDIRLGTGNGTSNSTGPSVITLCGATTDLANGAKVVWDGVDCIDCLALGAKKTEKKFKYSGNKTLNTKKQED